MKTVSLLLILAAIGVVALSETPHEAFRQAEAASREGKYAEAFRLYEAYLAAEPEGAFADIAHYRAGEAALRLGRYAAADDHFRAPILQRGPLAERAAFYAGLVPYRRGEYDRAFDRWGEAVRTVEDEAIAARAQYGRVWSAIRQKEWDLARAELDRMALLFPTEPLMSRAAALRTALERAERLPYRSPRKAKWLSTVLPGSGQIYAGRIGSGLASFALNGLFFYTTGRALAKRRWVDALFFYLIGSRFYRGGRQNAERFAREANEEAERRFIEALERYEE